MKYLLENLIVPLRDLAENKNPDENLTSWIVDLCGIDSGRVKQCRIIKRSVDARKKPDVNLIYRVAVEVDGELSGSAKKLLQPYQPDENDYPNSVKNSERLNERVLVVGTGPAGLMAALLLVEKGMKPIVIDRGYDVDKRGRDIDAFLSSRILNPESNYLYGEGGAGTYSDGKLYTRSKDFRARYVLEAFVEAGAPSEILYLQRPHVGSDKLVGMVKSLREKIVDKGGVFVWGTRVVDIEERNGTCVGVRTSNGDVIEGDRVLLATGHSDRALIRTLVSKGIGYQMKDFQVGCRVEHPQWLINQRQYGMKTVPSFLGAADYQIVSRPKNSQLANVASFCMCPGGTIIPATCEEGRLCTNGMSEYARDTEFANSALIVRQDSSNFASIGEAYEFLDCLERIAFENGGGEYVAPAQSAKGFVRGESEFVGGKTSYHFGVKPARLDELMPSAFGDSLQEALKYFDRLIPGFMETGNLIGVETRVSSPVRFERDQDTLMSTIKNLYFAGEGAGYASGIMSSAIDGLRVAENMLSR